MVVQELSKFHKIINIILNILISLFAILSFLLLISFAFFRNTELFTQSGFNVFLTDLSILLLIFAFVTIRDNRKRKVNLNINSNTILEINSKEKIEDVNKQENIYHSGNYIITDDHKIEIGNQEAFRILQLNTIYTIKTVSNKTCLLEREPEKLFDSIIGFIEFVIPWS